MLAKLSEMHKVKQKLTTAGKGKRKGNQKKRGEPRSPTLYKIFSSFNSFLEHVRMAVLRT